MNSDYPDLDDSRGTALVELHQVVDVACDVGAAELAVLLAEYNREAAFGEGEDAAAAVDAGAFGDGKAVALQDDGGRREHFQSTLMGKLIQCTLLSMTDVPYHHQMTHRPLTLHHGIKPPFP